MADLTRDELEQLALEACPTEEYYELRDCIDGVKDDVLRSIIAGTLMASVL